jgi:hypothetical protein
LACHLFSYPYLPVLAFIIQYMGISSVAGNFGLAVEREVKKLALRDSWTEDVGGVLGFNPLESLGDRHSHDHTADWSGSGPATP